MRALETAGFEVDPRFLTTDELSQLHAAIGEAAITGAGLRNLHKSNMQLAEFLTSPTVQPKLPRGRLVRSILFDKTPDRNWSVPWHQDVTIALSDRHHADGFSGWSLKEGVWHAQAPRDVLEQITTLRLHVDDCTEGNGPLRVLPATHQHGILSAEAIERFKKEIPEQTCSTRAGGAVFLRPLLLHASSRAAQPQHRRVLHLEFSAQELPAGLQWAD